MYIWNISRLKEELKSNQLTETDRFIYFFIYFILTSAVIEFFPVIEDGNDKDSIVSILNFTIYIIGTYLLYHVNGKSSGRDFLGRYFSLGFVVVIRFMMVTIPVGIVVALFFFEQNNDFATTAEAYVMTVWNLLFYWYFYKQFREINR